MKRLLISLTLSLSLFAHSDVFYEIFSRSFVDSNGDGHGDLAGITSKLDYIKSLGTGGIWLTPIFESPSYHGYDVTDYYKIHRQIGSFTILEKFLNEAHARHLRVLLDLPFNHVSSKHRWFQEMKSLDFFNWRETKPHWWGWHPRGSRHYLGVFGPDMPDLNWQNPEVLSEMEEVIRFYAQRGVDGFRLDAVKHLVEGPNGEVDTEETRETLETFLKNCKKAQPELFFVGEVWSDLKTIAKYKSLDTAFHFPAAYAIQNSLSRSEASELNWVLKESKGMGLSPFLSNHDMRRIASVLNNDREKLKLAATILYTLPNTPFIYYGEEIGMADGNEPGDEAHRKPMNWHEVLKQSENADSLLNHYKRLGELRGKTRELQDGEIEVINIAQKSSALSVYLRRLEKSAALVVLNVGESTLPQMTLNISGSFSKATALLGSATASLSATPNGTKTTIKDLPRRSGSVILLD